MENRNIINESIKFGQYETMIVAAALVFTNADRKADIEKIKECREILKKKTGALSKRHCIRDHCGGDHLPDDHNVVEHYVLTFFLRISCFEQIRTFRVKSILLQRLLFCRGYFFAQGGAMYYFGLRERR